MAGTFHKCDKINCYHCRLFRSVAKPRPCDHPMMMLFIVGGITTSEVKQIRDTVNLYKPDTQVNLNFLYIMLPIIPLHLGNHLLCPAFFNGGI